MSSTNDSSWVPAEPLVEISVHEDLVTVDGEPIEWDGVSDAHAAALQHVAAYVAAPLGRPVRAVATTAYGRTDLVVHPDGATSDVVFDDSAAAPYAEELARDSVDSRAPELSAKEPQPAESAGHEVDATRVDDLVYDDSDDSTPVGTAAATGLQAGERRSARETEGARRRTVAVVAAGLVAVLVAGGAWLMTGGAQAEDRDDVAAQAASATSTTEPASPSTTTSSPTPPASRAPASPAKDRFVRRLTASVIPREGFTTVRVNVAALPGHKPAKGAKPPRVRIVLDPVRYGTESVTKTLVMTRATRSVSLKVTPGTVRWRVTVDGARSAWGTTKVKPIPAPPANNPTNNPANNPTNNSTTDPSTDPGAGNSSGDGGQGQQSGTGGSGSGGSGGTGGGSGGGSHEPAPDPEPSSTPPQEPSGPTDPSQPEPTGPVDPDDG